MQGLRPRQRATCQFQSARHRLNLSPPLARILAATSTALVAILSAFAVLMVTGALRFNPDAPLAQVMSAQHEVEYTVPGPVVNAIFLGFTTLGFAVVGVVIVFVLFVAERLFKRKFRLRRALFKFWGVGAAVSALAAVALVYAAHRSGLAEIAALVAAAGGIGAATPVFIVWYCFIVAFSARASFGKSGA